MPVSAADLVWTGGDAFGNSDFNRTGNWQGNTLPIWGSTNSLKFTNNLQSSVTGLIYNWGDWRDVNDIVWTTSFPVSRTLSASSGGGIGFATRIENNSSFAQTVTMQTSGGLHGASDIQLNPVNGDLILSGQVFNDNERDYAVWGSLTATVTTLTLNTALGPNANPQTGVDFSVSAGRNSAIQVNASQLWEGTTTISSGSMTTGSGVTLASSSIVVAGGTFTTTSANTLADTAALTVNSGTLAIGGSDTVASLAGSGGTVNLSAGATLTAGSAGSTSYAGSITGSGGLTKVGSGTLTLSAASSFTGTTTVSDGRLALASANLLADSTAVTGAVGAVLELGGNEAIGSLAGALNVAIGSSTLTVGGNGQSTTYSGGISGTGSVTKVGGDTLRLTGTNSYGGATTVSAGTLQVDGSVAGPLSVAATGTLSGSGSVGGNAAISGTHSPGTSPGLQTFGGDLTYAAGAVVNWELIANSAGSAGTNFDQIAVGGNLSFAGSTTLALSFNAAGSNVDWANAFWNVNRSWMVYDLSTGTAGSLSNLAIGGALLDSLGNSLSPTNRGFFTTSLSGQDVMLNFTAVPEPSTLVVVGLAAVVAGVARCARQRVGAGR